MAAHHDKLEIGRPAHDHLGWGAFEELPGGVHARAGRHLLGSIQERPPLHRQRLERFGHVHDTFLPCAERVHDEEEDDGGAHGLGDRDAMRDRLVAAIASIGRDEDPRVHGSSVLEDFHALREGFCKVGLGHDPSDARGVLALGLRRRARPRTLPPLSASRR